MRPISSDNDFAVAFFVWLEDMTLESMSSFLGLSSL